MVSNVLVGIVLFCHIVMAVVHIPYVCFGDKICIRGGCSSNLDALICLIKHRGWPWWSAFAGSVFTQKVEATIQVSVSRILGHVKDGLDILGLLSMMSRAVIISHSHHWIGSDTWSSPSSMLACATLTSVSIPLLWSCITGWDGLWSTHASINSLVHDRESIVPLIHHLILLKVESWVWCNFPINFLLGWITILFYQSLNVLLILFRSYIICAPRICNVYICRSSFSLLGWGMGPLHWVVVLLPTVVCLCTAQLWFLDHDATRWDIIFSWFSVWCRI